VIFFLETFPMRKSAFFTTLAAVLAFASFSHAGSIIETGVTITSNGIGGTAGDVEIAYTGGTLSGTVAIDGGSLAADVSSITLTTPTEVTVDFTTPTTGGDLYFSFDVATGTPVATGYNLSDVTGSTLMHQLGLSVGSEITAVPEPTSMALLGVGMASFFVYRRYFRRVATA
jgi:hypothetical protein